MLRRLGTAGVAFALALGSGYLLQSGRLNQKPKPHGTVIADASITPLAADTPLPPTPGPMAMAERPMALPDLPRSPATLPQPGTRLALRVAALDKDWQAPAGASQARYDDFGKTCPATSLSLTPAGDGMMTLVYTNRCDAGARLIVAHEGIAAALTADASGRGAVSLPVIDAAGAVTVLSDSGEDLRIARPLRLSATPRITVGSDMARALSLASGSAAPLGDRKTPLAWTQPLQEGTAPMLRAAVTPDTCGRDLTAHVAVTASTRASVSDISIAMPDCTAIGQSVIVPLDTPAGQGSAARG